MRMMLKFCAIGAMAVLSGCVTAPVDTGRADYGALCAGCHGATGKGDGPATTTLEAPVPDLTGIAARNGGVFPAIEVMAQIDGYSREQNHGGMPAFWPLLEGDTVLIATGPDMMTPTPARLVALASYLESIQD